MFRSDQTIKTLERIKKCYCYCAIAIWIKEFTSQLCGFGFGFPVWHLWQVPIPLASGQPMYWELNLVNRNCMDPYIWLDGWISRSIDRCIHLSLSWLIDMGGWVCVWQCMYIYVYRNICFPHVFTKILFEQSRAIAYISYKLTFQSLIVYHFYQVKTSAKNILLEKKSW